MTEADVRVIDAAIDRLVNAVARQTAAIERQTDILRGVGAMLDDIANAIVEANEDRRRATGEVPTEEDEGDPLDLGCGCETCTSVWAEDHLAGECRSDCAICWVNSGNSIPCKCRDPKGCAMCRAGRFSPSRPVPPREGPHTERRTCPCRWCEAFRKSNGVK